MSVLNIYPLSPVDTEASVKIQEMGILPLLPTLLNPQSSCTPKVANVIAEVAKNGEAHFLFLHLLVIYIFFTLSLPLCLFSL